MAVFFSYDAASYSSILRKVKVLWGIKSSAAACLDKLNGSFFSPFPYLDCFQYVLPPHLISNLVVKSVDAGLDVACEMKPRGLFRAIVNH